MSSPTPLPKLEAQLVDAARRLDASTEGAAAPRRRWWRHGWTLLTLAVVGLGTGVAVARVAEIGPFAYLGRYTERNPKLAPTSVITVEPAGTAPAWQARAHVDGLGQLCITGGPRDIRTNPDPKPVNGKRNDPPSAGMTCADSDEIAQRLVDPNWPGATFSSNVPLDGRLNNNGVFVVKTKDGWKTGPPTRILVYTVAAAGLTPVVRWGATGAAIPMQRSEEQIRFVVDKRPDGLNAVERRQVASYPDTLDIALWAAEVQVPRGVDHPQVLFPSEFVPHGVDDATVEVAGLADVRKLVREGREQGWKYRRHISRDAAPVRSETASQRRRIAAFARPRTSRDTVPRRFRTEAQAGQRVQYAASRRLSIAGGGVPAAWLVPGGIPETLPWPMEDDRTCLLGSPLFGQCKGKPRAVRKPIVETVVCARSLNDERRTLVWALSPPGADRVIVSGPGTRRQQFDAAELIAVRRPLDQRISSLTWTSPDGRPVTVKAPWPKRTPRCGNRSPGWSEYRLDSDGSSSMGGGPRAKRPSPPIAP